jgi:hypothetical protein
MGGNNQFPHGVRQQRTAKHLQNKIATIECQMRQAVDFALTATGQGLQEDDPATFEKAILLKCKFWNELSPVFMERANIRPLLTTEDILGNGSPNHSSDECSNSIVCSQQHDNDDSDDDSDSSQHKKGRRGGVFDLSNSTDDDDDDDEEEEEDQHSKNDDDGSGNASSSHLQPVRKRHTKTKKTDGKAKKSKTEKRNTKKSLKKSPKKANIYELLQNLLVMKTEEMKEKKQKRREREEREEEKRKRNRVEDYDLTDIEQWLELSEKFKDICATVGGSKVQAALQFPKFAETNLLSAEEKKEFRRQQQQQQQQL